MLVAFNKETCLLHGYTFPHEQNEYWDCNNNNIYDQDNTYYIIHTCNPF